jgi:predicted ferric reductase
MFYAVSFLLVVIVLVFIAYLQIGSRKFKILNFSLNNYSEWSWNFTKFVLLGFVVLGSLFASLLSFIYVMADDESKDHIAKPLQQMTNPQMTIREHLQKGQEH